jgi:hypothetical protein
MKRRKTREVRIVIDKDGNLRAWNCREFEKIKRALGREDDRRRVILGPPDLCG